MTTEELSALAYQNAPAPKGLEPCALLCYEALRGVYQLHRAGLLPEEAAKSRKGDIAKAYAGAQCQRASPVPPMPSTRRPSGGRGRGSRRLSWHSRWANRQGKYCPSAWTASPP